MDERKNRILQAIVDDYVSTAEPVGSRTIARKYRLGVSPATIRNEMSDLEELGYIEQPHTSAGRVPSDRGYRYFVDCLMEVREVSAAENDLVRRTFERKARELELLVRETARLLSETTHLTAVVAAPQMASATFQEVRLVPLGRDQALLVLLTDTGFVENTVVQLPVEITLLELQKVGSMLSENLRGVPVAKLGRGALQELQRELRRYGALLEQALDFMAESMESGERRRIWLGGASHLLEQPEFRNVDKARQLLGILEQDAVVEQVIAGDDGDRDGVDVRIGEEIHVRDLSDCSVVTATYCAGDQVLGRLGVIGPKRMEYGRVVGILDQVRQHLSDAVARNRLVD